MPRLDDPWFGAEFYGQIEPGAPDGSKGGSFTMQADRMEGAQGLALWCPCGFNDPRFRTPDGGRPHWLLVPFLNPRNAPPCPPDHGPHRTGDKNAPRPRWSVSGNYLHDLTITPSIAVGSPECWHGFITNGAII